MRVDLLWTTPNAEKNVLKVARISSDQSNEKPGLIRYLLNHKHFSPFEHSFLSVQIRTSRAIAAQLLRHRSFVFQELSTRYTTPDSSIIYGARRQAKKNRQSSIDDLPEETKEWFREAQEIVAQECKKLYDGAIEAGIARESARFLLPLGTGTQIVMTGSIRSWLHYLELRTQEDTQLEHREIAEEIKTIFTEQFPIISEALGWV